MNDRQFNEALDRHITGNYGEDQFRNEQEDDDSTCEVFVCCDCKAVASAQPEKCGYCGGLCFSKEKLEDIESLEAKK